MLPVEATNLQFLYSLKNIIVLFIAIGIVILIRIRFLVIHSPCMTSQTAHPTIKAGDHAAYMEYALEQAHKAPPKPTNFRVGAVLLDADTNTIIATGYSLELPGNTHAEQTCFMKVAEHHNLPEEKIGEVLPRNTVLYTTMEPCNKRLSGNLTCVERILRLGNAIKVVYVGIKEPEKFVGQNLGRARLENAGIKVEHVEVEELEKRILETATAGHTKVD